MSRQMRAENSPLLRYTRDLASARSGYAVFTAPHMQNDSQTTLIKALNRANISYKACASLSPHPLPPPLEGAGHKGQV